MRVFVNDDRGYLDWVAANADGYVLNSYAHPLSGKCAQHRRRGEEGQGL